ncbi:NACHT domain-containing protein [Brevundimonas sp.]|uniref:NACHT domain-containing protein n=1 Tax=Brevundimonas sp. TaxID=1871086 RepID=UPI003D1506B4
MDFDFSRFSPRSFERFAQSLAKRALGEGVMVYGDGPDGGREAVFDGTSHFPSITAPWSGHSVVQVKFRQTSGTTAADADWLAGELRAELEAYIDISKMRRRPTNYLLITNAKLSPVPATRKGAGGIAKIDAIFEEYREAVGFEDYRIWHYDELCIRLADAEELRRAYSAWVTPSDVIEDVIANLKLSRLDFGAVMHRYLQKEIRSQRSTRLQQAGHGGGDSGTNLEEVFIDLPFEQPGSEPEARSEGLLLANLLSLTRAKLSPSALSHNVRPRPDRLLLLGGPGQGKSTISQLFGQILRASLLKAEAQRPLSVEVSDAVKSVMGQIRASGLSDEIPRRFPLRIDLPVYADALDAAALEGHGLSLLTFIRDHISTVANASDLPLDDLRSWMGGHPLVVLLDGLDEVPPSANRGSVILAINDLWDEFAAVDADVLMVVTSRPQGYNDDLDPALYAKLEMTPLQPHHALAYAERLAVRRLLDPVDQARVLERMREAIDTPTTARLLISPLQVAIMLALIDQRGEAPSDRWTLFHKYYNVVLEREQQKPGVAGRTVKTWSRAITALHESIGFTLHLQAESGGSSDAYVTKAQLAAQIKDELELEGYEGHLLDRATEELMDATTDRLVLLVERADERYSFEVRSLQEFMAAAHLMSGLEIKVQDRLREIASKSHWRHVFQIAASKCFSSNDTLHYRDTILQICRDLDLASDADRMLKSGARLALALLEDGLAHDSPLWRFRLLAQALEIVHFGSSSHQVNLLEEAQRAPQVTQPFLTSQLDAGSYRTRTGAWAFLIRLAGNGCDWALDLAQACWPPMRDRRLDVIALGIRPPSETPLDDLFAAVIAEHNIVELQERLDNVDFTAGQTALEALSSAYPWLQLLEYPQKDHRLRIPLHGREGKTPLMIQAMSLVSTAMSELYQDVPETAGWRAAQVAKCFAQTPSAADLAVALRAIERDDLLPACRAISIHMPWPLYAALQRAMSGEALAALAWEANEGRFGDTEDWLSAERRWKNMGLFEKDFWTLATKGLTPDINFDGAPNPTGLSITVGEKVEWDWLAELMSAFEASTPFSHAALRWIIEFAVEHYPPRAPFDPATAQLLIGDDDEVWVQPHLVTFFSKAAQADHVVLERVARKATVGRLSNMAGSRERGRSIPQSLLGALELYPALIVLFMNLQGADALDIPGVPEAAARLVDHKAPRVAAMANVMTLVASRGDEGDLRSVLSSPLNSIALMHLMDALAAEALPPTVALGVATEIAQEVAGNHSDAFDRALALVSRFADQRRSDLTEPGCAERLALRSSLCRPQRPD